MRQKNESIFEISWSFRPTRATATHGAGLSCPQRRRSVYGTRRHQERHRRRRRHAGIADRIADRLQGIPRHRVAAQRGLDRSRTILLTDSSTMMPSRFAEATGRPDKYLKGYIDAGKTGIAVGEGFYKYE